MTDFVVIPPKVNPAKSRKNKPTTAHRDSKTGVHTTVGGKGHVARVYRKGKP